MDANDKELRDAGFGQMKCTIYTTLLSILVFSLHM